MKLRAKTSLTLTTAAFVAAGSMAVAGDGNEASVLQETTPREAVGNSLSIDQSGATRSTVAGVTRNGTDPTASANSFSLEDENETPLDAGDQPDATEFLSLEDSLITFDPEGSATQSGSGNEASITITGNGTTVGLYQGNSIDGFGGEDNTGTIFANSGRVLLYQDGNRNNGTLTTRNGASLASLLQKGNGNEGTVTVSGSETEGRLAQIGNENDTELSVDTDGASVSFTVAGDSTTASLPASVVSSVNSGQITIIQRPLN